MENVDNYVDKCTTIHIFVQKLSIFVHGCSLQINRGRVVQRKSKVVNLNSKAVMIVVTVLTVVQLVLSYYVSMELMGDSFNNALIDYTIVIDAGHGGIDSGVVSDNGTKESNLNLQYSKQLGEHFTDVGFNVKYTRTDNGGLYGLPTPGFKMRDMIARKEIIEQCGADIVISVHMNKYQDSSRSGPQVFYQTGETESQKLADSIQLALNDFTGNTHSALKGDYYICRTSEMPAVIVECGFLSNREEESKLLTKEYCGQLTDTIFRGVMLYLYST